ncbi:MAG: hypothetical protein IPK82_38360 [Polyangiaceae bacterium]|nr:hypothetical protein [Polyangiaceae bacterium]
MGVRFTLWAVDAERILDVLSASEVAAAREDSLQLQQILRRASDSPHSRGILQLLLDGHRRWWIGSFLESLRQSSPWLQNNTDADHAEKLLSIMFAGLDCGTPIRPPPAPTPCAPFPITPRVDADLRFATLSVTDFSFLRLFFSEYLQNNGRRFSRPSGHIGIAPDDDVEWDAWVRQVIQEITAPLEIRDPSLVSLLG